MTGEVEQEATSMSPISSELRESAGIKQRLDVIVRKEPCMDYDAMHFWLMIVIGVKKLLGKIPRSFRIEVKISSDENNKP